MEPRFTLRQIRYFLAAAKAGSVNQAAYDVNISAPSISAAISQIEDQYNIQLFVRHHSHGLLMTENGKAFFAVAKAFFEHAEQLESDAQGLGKTISSIVNAGCFLTLAPVIIPLIATAFTRSHPESRLSFVEGHQAWLLSAVRDGIVQIAFTYKFGLGRDLAFELLGEVEPYCIMPIAHRLAKADRIDLREIADDPMILLDLPKSDEYYLSLYDLTRISPRIAHRTTSPEVARVMVAHGLGYSILAMPVRHTFAIDGSEFVARPLAGDLPKLGVGLLTTAETATSYTYSCVRRLAKSALADLLLPV